jgi:NADPH2:quinone reductase
MMHAIQVSQHGGPEVLDYIQLPDPQPGPGQVLVKINAAGVNYVDVYHRMGRYPQQLPFTPGLEAAGIVEATGAKVDDFKPGQRVAWAQVLGSYAEYALAPAERVVTIPDELENRLAAALLLQGMTAHMLAKDVFPIQPGQTVLIHAAAGGVGLLLTQVAKMLGARVLGTTSTEAKAEKARQAGADEVILYSHIDFESEVKRLTDGKGVHVVYDSVGATTFEKSLKCLRKRGMLVLFGSASGLAPKLDPNALGGMGSLYLTRPSLGHYTAERDELLQRAGEIFQWAVSGKLNVNIHKVYPLRDAAQAHSDLEGRLTSGKLLLAP